MHLNDYELLYYCYQENEASFELLANKYEKYIYYIINLFKKKYYFFGSEDIDLYNEALILLYECIYTFKEDTNVPFSSYFFACLKKKYLYLIRTLMSNKNKIHVSALSLDTSLINEKLDLYSIVDNKELAVSEQVYQGYLIEETIITMKDNLSELENKIIYYYLYGYSYKEIAKVLLVDIKKIDNTIQKYKKLVKHS